MNVRGCLSQTEAISKLKFYDAIFYGRSRTKNSKILPNLRLPIYYPASYSVANGVTTIDLKHKFECVLPMLSLTVLYP